MTNISFFKGLPDFDSLTAEEQGGAIAYSDRENLAKLLLLLNKFSWHEKMAIGLIAFHAIDATPHQLIQISPAWRVQYTAEASNRTCPKTFTSITQGTGRRHSAGKFYGEIEVKNES
jgi:hypothetical protein